MTKRLFVAFLLLSHLAVAQNGELLDSGIAKQNVHFIKLPVSGLIESYANISAGYQFPVSDRTALGFTAGYLYAIQPYAEEAEGSFYKNERGVKLSAAYRVYLQSKNPFPFSSRFYIEPNVIYNYIDFGSERIAAYACNDDFGDCEYYRLYDVQIQRQVLGAFFNMGKQFSYDPFFFELFMGLGAYLTYEDSPIPNQPEPDRYYYRNRGRAETLNEFRTMLRIGLTFSYKIK